jgi:hypothetical protein
MTTRVTIAVSVLVLAIVFGFIFWNQFASNQHELAGGDDTPYTVQTNKTSVPKNDTVSSIETDLNATDTTGIDSDSSQLNTQLNGF